MSALKMDELLVTWLNNDGVYESIVSMIEQCKHDNLTDVALGKGHGNGRPVSGSYLPPLSPMKFNQGVIASSKGKGGEQNVTIPLNTGGRGRGKAVPEDALEVREKFIFQAFTSIRGARVSPHEIYLRIDEFGRLITKPLCGLPTFFTVPLFRRICNTYKYAESTESSGNDDIVTLDMFIRFWKDEIEPYDASDRFFRLVKKPGVDFITKDDFSPFIDELLSCHPGLEFLSNHAEFQEKYATTVITRIFYIVNTNHDGRITARQVRRSALHSSFLVVDEEEDINKVTQYFSYEHFYVLYCRFWELDQDRDYKITRDDLVRYNEQSLSRLIVDRIFDAAPRPFDHIDDRVALDKDGSKVLTRREYLSYEDFIFFMLSEEDKANETSVRYWFSCIDVFGEGKLNFMEMRSFYSIQMRRMQTLGQEVVPFEDMLCQMLDMIKPNSPNYLIVDDFLQPECSQVSGALFDALFNLNKYLQYEQRDPFMERQKREDEFDCEWDRFACVDYSRLAMEEEAREEEAMEIDWVTIDDGDDDDGDEFMHTSREAPF